MRNSILNITSLSVVLCLVCVSSLAQSPEATGTIYLKNGWIVEGRYHVRPEGGVILFSPRGDKWTIPSTDIDSIRETKKKGMNASWHRFGHYTEIGALAATKNRPDNVTTAAFSFQVVNGYRFKPAWFIGLGTGLDLYATQTTLPVFASLRTDILPHRDLTPYLFIDAGQGFDISTGNAATSYRGGALLAAGFGLKVHVSERTSFHVQAGYRLQKGTVIDNGVEKPYDNQRVSLRAGFSL